MTYHWTDDAACPVFKTRIDATGPAANINRITATACRLLAEIDVPPDRIDKLRENVRSAVNYDQAVGFVEYWFPVDRETT